MPVKVYLCFTRTTSELTTSYTTAGKQMGKVTVMTTKATILSLSQNEHLFALNSTHCRSCLLKSTKTGVLFHSRCVFTKERRRLRHFLLNLMRKSISLHYLKQSESFTVCATSKHSNTRVIRR